MYFLFSSGCFPQYGFVIGPFSHAVLARVLSVGFFFLSWARLVPVASFVGHDGCSFFSAFAGGGGYAILVLAAASCSPTVLF